MHTALSSSLGVTCLPLMAVCIISVHCRASEMLILIRQTGQNPYSRELNMVLLELPLFPHNIIYYTDCKYYCQNCQTGCNWRAAIYGILIFHYLFKMFYQFVTTYRYLAIYYYLAHKSSSVILGKYAHFHALSFKPE